jgi:oxygen-independent coproporphyrinogen-3 oxidase
VHVPFCARKCQYCAFYSEASDGAVINRYVGALIAELEVVAPELRPQTVFFGGGTPSLLNLNQWQKIFEAMKRLQLLGAGEWTIECNPATVSPDKAKLWRAFGVNRISLGVQSLDENLLERLGRIHNRRTVFKSFDLLRRSGFENINLDLMFAIPGQTMEAWRSTLTEALALGSEHLSSYEVIYEEDTPLYAQLQAGQFSVDEDLACAMYDELLASTAQHGLQQYEVANFARPKTKTNSSSVKAPDDHMPAFACRHNVNYWRGGSYHGLGPSAAGYVRGARTKNWSNTVRYCEQLEQGKRAIESREELSPIRRAGETAAFGFRMNAGWPFVEFQQQTGYDLRQEWAAEIEQLIGWQWARRDSERIHLTNVGLRFADAAAELFLK